MDVNCTSENSSMVATGMTFQNSMTLPSKNQIALTNTKCQFQCGLMWLLASTYSRPQFPLVHLHWKGFNKFSFFFKDLNRWGHGDPKCFLQHSMVLKQSCWSISIFHKFSSKWKFFRLKIQFPEECSPLTISWPMATLLMTLSLLQ